MPHPERQPATKLIHEPALHRQATNTVARLTGDPALQERSNHKKALIATISRARRHHHLFRAHNAFQYDNAMPYGDAS